MDDTYDDSDGPEVEPWDEPGEGLFDEPVTQDGPGLFDDEPAEASVDAAVAPAGEPALEVADEPADAPATRPQPEAQSLAAPSSKPRAQRPTEEIAAPLALYRRYRPDTFDEVIGQEHVTEPLKRALTNNKVNHAYLFSGPRGCGKTTSARILARSLNCEQGPTPVPCGKCQSCLDLARGGPGSIDVIEMDAASNGGVEDARDLRERAFFAPVQSRYKIYIVDEAHMVTTAGFNALLKLVEEPPPHVKFIFATTEPEKVIGTIRSRTHHYPFRLVPPKVLVNHLSTLCEKEKVTVDPEVLPLVVRAGAGSVRDSLSVLDQLLGAAGEHGVEYESAAALLGYTPDALLDEIVDAFAARDGRGVFATIDKVIEVGQDPRRFAEDLLHRLRDLVIVAAVPDAVSSGLIEVSGDQAERLSLQAAAMGAGELTRAAEVIAEGLTEMRGTTAPRLHLELMCSRVLLPGADVDDRGIHARLERLERRLAEGGVPVTHRDEQPAPEPRQEWTDTRPAAPEQQAAPTQRPERPAQPDGPPTQPTAPPSQDAPRQRPARQRPAQAPPSREENLPENVVPLRGGQASNSAPAGTIDTARMRQEWPRVLDEVQKRRRFTWILLSQNAQVASVENGVLTLAFANPGARDRFNSSGSHDLLRDAIVETLGADLKIVTTGDGGDGPRGPSGHGGSGGPSQQRRQPEQRTQQPAPQERPLHPHEPPPHDDEVPPPPDEEPEPEQPHRFSEAARAAARQPSTQINGAQARTEDAGESRDDADLDDAGGDAVELILRELGGEIIEQEQR